MGKLELDCKSKFEAGPVLCVRRGPVVHEQNGLGFSWGGRDTSSLESEDGSIRRGMGQLESSQGKSAHGGFPSQSPRATG